MDVEPPRQLYCRFATGEDLTPNLHELWLIFNWRRHHVAEQGDEYVKLADQALSGVSLSANFGTYIVDYLPIRASFSSYIPSGETHNLTS
jgi:hypothetical protein